MIDSISGFLKRANVSLPAPVSSFIVLSVGNNASSNASTTTDKRAAKVIQHHRISDPIAVASKVLSTLSSCEDLLTAVDDDTDIKLLRLQSEATQSIIITGEFTQACLTIVFCLLTL